MIDCFNIDSIWKFSIEIYADDDVKQACLVLQDSCGCDVLIVLSCLFAAATGSPELTKSQMAQALDQAGPWRNDAIRSLRLLRNNLKIKSYFIEEKEKLSFRERVKALEIEAERLALEALEPLFKGHMPPSPDRIIACARANLSVYVHTTGIAPNDALSGGFETLLAALAKRIAVRGETDTR